MPALVNMSVGSFLITMGADGTISCPLFRKKSRKAVRISEEVIVRFSCEMRQSAYICHRKVGEDNEDNAKKVGIAASSSPVIATFHA